MLLAEAEENLRQIRQRAFDYFQRRGQELGNDWDDWLRAEREVVWSPHAEMFESPLAIVLRVAVPGFNARSLKVTATPQSLLVQGTEIHEHGGLDSRLHFCEFGQRLFRRFDLPARIDPRKVSATLDKGILEVFAYVARRTQPSQNGACAPQAEQRESPELQTMTN